MRMMLVEGRVCCSNVIWFHRQEIREGRKEDPGEREFEERKRTPSFPYTPLISCLSFFL